MPDDAESFLQGGCPIVRSYGGRDRSLKGAAATLERLLDKVGVAHDVKEYPDASDGFLNDHNSVLFAVMENLMGAGYHEASAAGARRRIVAFFRTHLAPT